MLPLKGIVTNATMVKEIDTKSYIWLKLETGIYLPNGGALTL